MSNTNSKFHMDFKIPSIEHTIDIDFINQMTSDQFASWLSQRLRWNDPNWVLYNSRADSTTSIFPSIFSRTSHPHFRNEFHLALRDLWRDVVDSKWHLMEKDDLDKGFVMSLLSVTGQFYCELNINKDTPITSKIEKCLFTLVDDPKEGIQKKDASMYVQALYCLHTVERWWNRLEWWEAKLKEDDGRWAVPAFNALIDYEPERAILKYLPKLFEAKAKFPKEVTIDQQLFRIADIVAEYKRSIWRSERQQPTKEELE